MPKTNSEIADLFERLADLLEIEDNNAFRVRAYRNAARVIRNEPRSMVDLVESGFDLEQLPDIGEAIAEKIRTLVKTDKLPQLEAVSNRIPAALGDLMHLPGLGPKRVKALYDALNIRSMDDLQRAARRGKIAQLPGFGDKLQGRILQALQEFGRSEKRWYLAEAEAIARPLVKYLKSLEGVDEVLVAGSFRRRRETVGDLDVLVTCAPRLDVCGFFAKYDQVGKVESQGRTRATVHLKSGIQVDLRVVPAASYGAALYYFTGSRNHNLSVRAMAARQGLKINEYGVYRGQEWVAGRTEKSVFRAVGLSFIEPELREDRGEIEAAAEGRLPRLVEARDIRGDLHCHTDASDGRESLRTMAEAAQAKGYHYIAITDHSPQVRIAHGQPADAVLRQLDEIDRLNDQLREIRVLKSAEVDILRDGSLDLPDEVLERLDLVLCALHYRFDLNREKQTSRLLKALDSPYCQILAHPLGRLINGRDPIDFDLEKVLEQAVRAGCALEINGQPSRLDLPDTHIRHAQSLGARFVLSTDAHSLTDLGNMAYALDQARRGWLEAKDILNTLPLDQLLASLRRA